MRTRSLLFALGMLLPTLASAATFTQDPFTDVTNKHPNYEAIEYLRKNNVLKGYLDGTFKPDARINRAEFVKLIVNPFIIDTERMNDCLEKEVKDSPTVFFRDVQSDSWYARETCFAKIKRLIDGYPDGTFRPRDYISFVEGAKIMSNAFAFELATETTGEKWYEPYVKYLIKIKAVPTSITQFAGKLTRGDMAEMLYRLKTHTTTKSAQTYEKLK